MLVVFSYPINYEISKFRFGKETFKLFLNIKRSLGYVEIFVFYQINFVLPSFVAEVLLLEEVIGED